MRFRPLVECVPKGRSSRASSSGQCGFLQTRRTDIRGCTATRPNKTTVPGLHPGPQRLVWNAYFQNNGPSNGRVAA
jgi:hypothetical protein